MTLGTEIPEAVGPYRLTSAKAIAGDASRRRYWRVGFEAGRGVLCIYPATDRTLVSRDLEVLRWLGAQGLPVPRILAVEREGLEVLLEDLGTRSGEEFLEASSPDAREGVVLSLLEPLCRLISIPPGDVPPWNPPMNPAFLRWELTTFELWCVDEKFEADRREELGCWLDELAERIGAHPIVPCLRDYHLENIVVSDQGRIGIIDVQDLRIGPDTYDLASLLFDREAPRLLSPTQREAVSRRWAETVALDEGWRQRLDETSLQRMLKVLGTFSFLGAQGRTAYGRWIIPTARRALESARELGAPDSLIENLLDLSSTGGCHAR